MQIESGRQSHHDVQMLRFWELWGERLQRCELFVHYDNLALVQDPHHTFTLT